jgi:hypothetical protein
MIALAIAAAGVSASCGSKSEGSGGTDGGGSGMDGGGGGKADAPGSTHDGSVSGGDGGKAGDAKSAKDAPGFVSHDAGSNCGARTNNPCGDGAMCMTGPDCQSGLCTGGVCVAPPPSCTDGMKDAMETDVDCGGPVCPPCGTNKDCLAPTDCVSLNCVSGMCVAATPMDGIKNDSETDIDCGGALQADGSPNAASDGAPACAVGQTCLLPSDCSQGVCNGMAVSVDGGVSDAATPGDAGALLYCQPPSPTDGVQNDSETDVDCGGGTSPASDGAPACATGKMCSVGADCVSLVCNANGNKGGPPTDCPAGTMGCVCQDPSPTDGVQNGGETDVDCGGSASANNDGAPACAPGQMCLVGTDCSSQICSPNNTCTIPSPTDGVKNDSETDVDCGGALVAGGGQNAMSDGAPPCIEGKGCLIPSDCYTDVCKGGMCAPAACSPTCADNAGCGADSECASGFCSLISHTCVAGQSCKGLITPAPIMDIAGCYNEANPAQPLPCPAGSSCDTNTYDCYDNLTNDVVGTPDTNGAGQNAGLDTCGAGESTDPVAMQKHESCCRSLVVPGTNTRMDKYEVTAGRVRQWIESVNNWCNGNAACVTAANPSGAYNLRAWVQAQLTGATAIGTRMLQQMPLGQAGASTPNIVPLFAESAEGNDPLNLVQELGGTSIDPNVPSGQQGCNMGAGREGASTYWWPASSEADVGSPPRAFTQDYYDIKPFSCALYWIGAAFCAWDGGRLANDAEYTAVWPSTYPWAAGTYPVIEPSVAQANAAANMGIPITSYTIDFVSEIGWYSYPSYALSNPTLSVPSTEGPGTDFTPFIAAPGRFVLDLTAVKSPGTTEGWYDVGANLMEMKMAGAPWSVSQGAFVNAQNQVYASNGFTVNWTGGDFEGHPIQRESYNEAEYTMYGKVGFRCARALEP